MKGEAVLLVLAAAAFRADWNALMKAESDSLLNTTRIMAGGGCTFASFGIALWAMTLAPLL